MTKKSDDGISSHVWLFSIGAWGFLIASPLFFPVLYSLPGAAMVAGCMFTAGSVCFLIADLTDNHLNFASIVASAAYAAGSALFIPTIFNLFWGSLLFVVGSGFVIISKTGSRDFASFLIMLGGAWYLVGSTCGVGATGFCDLNILAAMYTAGGLCFWAASIVYLCRESPLLEEVSLPSSK